MRPFLIRSRQSLIEISASLGRSQDFGGVHWRQTVADWDYWCGKKHVKQVVITREYEQTAYARSKILPDHVLAVMSTLTYAPPPGGVTNFPNFLFLPSLKVLFLCFVLFCTLQRSQ